MKLMVLVLGMVSVWTRVSCLLAADTDNESVEDTDLYKYITYMEGDSNIIIAAPHGGNTTLPDIPRRHYGCWDGDTCDYSWNCSSGVYSRNKCYASLKADLYTKQVTEHLVNRLHQRTQKRPYVIILNIHRQDVDVNRPIKVGTASFPLAEEVWHEFHGAVQKARKSVKGPGVFFEIHGHAHKHGLTEIGYRVLPENLNKRDFSACDTSIKHLACRVNVNTSLADLFWGEDASFGGMLKKAGLESLPSPDYPSPGDRMYFRGGYDTWQYGSQLGGEIDGIQVELPKWIRNAQNYTRGADALVASISEYTHLYY